MREHPEKAETRVNQISLWFCLDVGGTAVKAGLLREKGEPLEGMASFPARAQGDKEEILENFAEMLRELAYRADSLLGPGMWKAEGIGLAFPGPFDYERGIPLLKGLDKYDSLYGIPLGRELSRRMAGFPGNLPEAPMLFCNDVQAFALGEELELPPISRGLYVCIGTGCGSAFLENGGPPAEGTPGVPEHGWIYPLPFLSGTLDDYLSKRGFLRLAEEICGRPMEGKEASLLAASGEERALLCFGRFGERLRDGLIPVLDAYHPEALVLGGQLMKSASLFLEPLETACQKRGILLKISTETSQSAAKGLRRQFFSGSDPAFLR